MHSNTSTKPGESRQTVLARWTPLKWASKMHPTRMDTLYKAKPTVDNEANNNAANNAGPAPKRVRLSLADM